MFIASLLTIAKIQKQSECILTDKEMSYTYHGILLSLNKEGNPANCDMSLEDIMLSKINQSQKDKYCMIPLIRGI